MHISWGSGTAYRERQIAAVCVLKENRDARQSYTVLCNEREQSIDCLRELRGQIHVDMSDFILDSLSTPVSWSIADSMV